MAGVEKAAIVEGESIVWREPDRLVEVGKRLVEIILGRVGDAAAVVRRGAIGSEADCPVEVGERVAQIAGPHIAVAAVIEELRQAGPAKTSRPDRLGASGDLLGPGDIRIAGAFQIAPRLRLRWHRHRSQRPCCRRKRRRAPPPG